ncbi:helix-turn-helix domain-containing protein [Actinoalloteichus sp. AHMU CJ021]
MKRTSKLRTPRARAVGHALRTAREDAGVGVRELARRLSTSHTWVGRVERAEVILTPELVATIVGALELPRDQREALISQTRDLPAASPWTPSTSLPGQLATLIDYEREAARVTSVATLIPGLLQTRDYAHAMISAGTGSYSSKDLVLTRMGRQEVLRGKNAPEYTAYVDESALMRRVGGPRIMYDQLDHLIEHPHATIRIVPLTMGPQPGLPVGAMGNFGLLEFVDAAPVVYLEHLTTGTYLDRRADTDAYATAVDTLAGVALSPDDSVKTIATYRDQYEGQAE